MSGLIWKRLLCSRTFEFFRPTILAMEDIPSLSGDFLIFQAVLFLISKGRRRICNSGSGIAELMKIWQGPILDIARGQKDILNLVDEPQPGEIWPAGLELALKTQPLLPPLEKVE